MANKYIIVKIILLGYYFKIFKKAYDSGGRDLAMPGAEGATNPVGTAVWETFRLPNHQVMHPWREPDFFQDTEGVIPFPRGVISQVQRTGETAVFICCYPCFFILKEG